MFCIAVVVVVNIFILLIAANILCSIVWYKLGANVKKKNKRFIVILDFGLFCTIRMQNCI